MAQIFQILLDICTLVGGLAAVPVIYQFVRDRRAKPGVRSQRLSQDESTIPVDNLKPSAKNHPARVEYVYVESGFLKGLVAAFPWAFFFAVIGEYLLIVLFGFSHFSILYTLLILPFWAAGIPVGVAVRPHPWKISLLVAGIGVAALIGISQLLTHINTSYLSK